MKFGHLLFPVFFFLILIFGAFLILRTVEEQSYLGSNQPVYLDSTQQGIDISVEAVSTTREQAHQAFTRFSDTLVSRNVLSSEERTNLEQILQLGEAHWDEENWAPAFYAFERVLNDLDSLIDEDLGVEKATELEAQYSEVSQNVTNEIVLVEATYLDAIETANLGYNALQDKDWIGAIQSFAKAIDSLNLVKVQAAEIISQKIKEAYIALEAGDTETSSELFNEVLAVYPDKEEAIKGLQLIQTEVVAEEAPIAMEPDSETAETEVSPTPDQALPVPEELEMEEAVDDNPIVAQADRHFARRELKESLSLYLEAKSKDPTYPKLTEKINRTRKALRKEELIRLMDKASILGELGQWAGAVKTYRHVLNVDPVNKEARVGWEEALVKMVAQKEIDQYKALISHHINAKQFAHAKDIVTELKTMMSEREDLDELILPFEYELEEQLLPVNLVIESDGETWVTIPGKMAPERFQRKEITLFPGKLKIFGWKEGYEHRSVALSFKAQEAPESIQVICDVPLDESIDYEALTGSSLVAAGLARFDVADLLTDFNSFATWFLMGGTKAGPLTTDSQIEDWKLALISKLYAALSQQADQEFDLIRLDARAHYIKVPKNLTRKETIELGQYLLTFE